MGGGMAKRKNEKGTINDPPQRLEWKQKVMDYKFKTKPYKHQLTALEKSWDKSTFAYFMKWAQEKLRFFLII